LKSAVIICTSSVNDDSNGVSDHTEDPLPVKLVAVTPETKPTSAWLRINLSGGMDRPLWNAIGPVGMGDIQTGS
jgi:hypothetical protein